MNIRNFTNSGLRINDSYPISADVKRMPELHTDSGFIVSFSPNHMFKKEHIQIIKCKMGFLHVVVCESQIGVDFNNSTLPEHIKGGHVIWDSYIDKEQSISYGSDVGVEV